MHAPGNFIKINKMVGPIVIDYLVLTMVENLIIGQL